MNNNHSIFYYIFVYPFVWIYEQLEYFFYVYIYPIYTGKPVAQGWNPKLVREQNPNYWNPSVPLEINYQQYKNVPNEILADFGIEKTKTGHLRRLYSPQMYYADPEKAYFVGDKAKKYYADNEVYMKQEYKKKVTLDPFNSNNEFYYKEFKIHNFDVFTYNIQSSFKLFNLYTINIIEVLFSIIFFLIFFLCYFIFYHLYKINLKLERAEYILNENNLSLFKAKEDISAKDMNEAWKESTKITKNFDLGIELDFCVYEGTLIGFELFILMFSGYLIKLFSSFFSYYVIGFYDLNSELFTYCFSYLFAFLALFYWFKYKKEQKKAIHRWVEIDYYFSYFLTHYFRTLCWLNVYKLVTGAPLYVYVIIYTLSMIWIYLACDSCDYFMGWNQEYRIDIYNRQTNMHFWWPRILMNQTWHHGIITLMKPIHTKVAYLVLFFLLPILALYFFIVKLQNKIHVYINNKFFFWNSERYTIDQIEDQWQKDREYNYKKEQEEKNNKGGGLIIL